MKEAAGEANMTVITIVLVGVVAAAGAILLPKLFTSMEMKSVCSEMGGTLAGKKCTYKKSDGTETSCNVTKCATGPAADTWVCGSCPV